MPNIVVISGNLVADPELRSTSGGKHVCNATVAHNNQFKKGNVSYIDVRIWAASGEAFAKYHQKGDPVIITGYLQQDRWESSGGKRSKLVVVSNSWEFGKPKSKDSVPRETSAKRDTDETDYSVEEVPF